MTIQASGRKADRVLSEEFLVARSKILELAATLDRLDRAEGSVQSTPQLRLLELGLAILTDQESNKAERVQLLMSRQYDPQWRQSLDVDSGRISR